MQQQPRAKTGRQAGYIKSVILLLTMISGNVELSKQRILSAII